MSISANDFNQDASVSMIGASSGANHAPFRPLVGCNQNEGIQQSHCVSGDLDRKGTAYMNMDNLHKMIQRFLVEKGMTKKELADVLEITVRNLEHLFSEDVPAGLLCKVNLPLVSLYCRTRWGTP